MRGSDAASGKLLSYVDWEKRVPAGHPLRVSREVVNATLAAMSAEFDALYSPVGRESIPPERRLRALLLQTFSPSRSERQLGERRAFDLLFRWVVGLGMDDPVWDATSFAPEPRPPAGGRDRQQVSRRRAGAAAGQGVALGRAFLGGWHAAGDVGQHQERPAQGRLRAAARSRPQRRAGLPRPEAEQRDARLHHRPGCPALPPGTGQAGSSPSP